MTELRRGVGYYIREQGSAAVIRAFQDIRKASFGAARGVDLAQRALDRMGREGSEAADGIDLASKATERLGEEAARAGQRGQSGFRRFRDELVPLEAGVSLVQKAVAGMRRVIETASGPVGLAIDFNRSFNEIRTLTDDVTEDLRDELSRIAADVPQTAAEVTEATYAAISGGVAAADVGQFIRDAASAASAANTQLTSTTNALLGATNAFASQQLTSAEASDVLFATIAAGITRMDDLEASLGQVNSQAAAAGLSFAEVGAAVAAMTKQGISTGAAVTQLRGLINGLTKPAAQTAKMFKKLGFEFGFARLRTDGLAKTLADLEARANAAGVELGAVFRRNEATQGLLQLAGNNAAAFADALDRTESSAGATGKALGKMTGDARGLLSQIQAGTEGLLRDLGQEVLPIVKDGMRELLEYMRDNGPALVESFRGAVASAIELGRWVGTHGKELLGFVTSFFVASRVTAFAQAITGSLIPAIGKISAGGLGGALSMALKSPSAIGLAVGGAFVLGNAIGETIGDVMAAEAYASMDRIEAEAKRRADEFKREFGMDLDTATKKQDRVNRGEALGYGRGIKDDLFNVPVADFVAQKVQAGATREEAKAAAEDEVMREVAARARRAEALEAEAASTYQEAERLRIEASKMFSHGALKRGNELLAQSQRATDVVADLRAEAQELTQAAGALTKTLADVDTAAPAPPKTGGATAKPKGADLGAMLRDALRLRDELADRQIALIEDEGRRASEALREKHFRELRDRKLNFDQVIDLITVQSDEERNLAAKLAKEAAEKAAQRHREGEQFRARFIEDATQRELEQRRLQYEEDLRLAKKHGGDMLAVARQYHQQRQQIIDKAAAAEALAHASAVSAILGSAIQIAEELGVGQQIVAGLKAAEMGARAAEEVAHAAAAAAVPGGQLAAAAHGAAAVAYGVAGVKWGGSALGVTAPTGGGGSAGPAPGTAERRTVSSGQREVSEGPTNISYVLNFPGRALATSRDIEDATMRAVARGADRPGQQRFSERRGGGR